MEELRSLSSRCPTDSIGAVGVFFRAWSLILTDGGSSVQSYALPSFVDGRFGVELIPQHGR